LGPHQNHFEKFANSTENEKSELALKGLGDWFSAEILPE
jgi:hypothetical protein